MRAFVFKSGLQSRCRRQLRLGRLSRRECSPFPTLRIYSEFVLDSIVHLISRFVHIFSVILFLGGVAYSWQVLRPLLNELPESLRMQAAAGAQLRHRTALYVLLGLIILSGFYNFLTYAGPKHTQAYQIAFGIKMLLVAHMLSSAILWATSPYGDVTVAGKGKHRLLSIAIAGVIVVLISAYLRSLTLQGL
jgi:hypothetical protein